jgi:hypothetical protein
LKLAKGSARSSGSQITAREKGRLDGAAGATESGKPRRKLDREK